MIQRIQSVWLLLASVCSFLTLKFPFYSGTYNQSNEPYQVLTSFELNANQNTYLLITTIFLGLVGFLTIFLFKKRKLQLLFCIFAICIDVLIIFMYYLHISSFSKGTFSLTALLHVLIIVFLFFAASAINKDEKMVKNSDRLR
jgi:heme/copper-type cytochrome/quinol oxidase subunit 4